MPDYEKFYIFDGRARKGKQIMFKVRRKTDGRYITLQEALEENHVDDNRLWELEGFAWTEYNSLMIYDTCGNYAWLDREKYDVEIVI